MLETQLLHLVNGVVALLAAAIPIYLTMRLKNNLRQLTAILSIFILVHAVHSWLGFFGFDFLSDGVFEPLSAAVLMLFGIFYYWIAKQKKVSIKRMVIIWSPVPVLFIFLGTIVLLLATLSIFVWLAAFTKQHCQTVRGSRIDRNMDGLLLLMNEKPASGKCCRTDIILVQ